MKHTGLVRCGGLQVLVGYEAPGSDNLLSECHQTHLLEQLRHNLLEALHNHRVGWLRALAAPDLLLGTQLRAVEVDAAATTSKRRESCTSHTRAMALHTTLPMAGQATCAVSQAATACWPRNHRCCPCMRSNACCDI